MADKTGGPAFPWPTPSPHQAYHGMTLRDYFAAKAMAALIVARGGEILPGSAGWPTHAEREAYKIADAMLAARGDA